jgi:hypothetical protein
VESVCAEDVVLVELYDVMSHVTLYVVFAGGVIGKRMLHIQTC